MTDLVKSFNITARDFAKAGESSLQIQSLLKSIGFEPDLIRRISICAYEAEMNAVMHGGDGELLLTVDPKNIVLEVSDDGPGCELVNNNIPNAKGVGLRNTRERLAAIYGAEHSIKLSQTDPHGLTICIRIPFTPKHQPG